jgi:hypothetical protein
MPGMKEEHMEKMKLKYLGIAVAMAVLVGCGSGNVAIEQNKAAVTNARSLRSYFDSSKGDYKALSPADQAAAQKAAGGGPEAVQKMFDFMKTSNKTAAKTN